MIWPTLGPRVLPCAGAQFSWGFRADCGLFPFAGTHQKYRCPAVTGHWVQCENSEATTDTRATCPWRAAERMAETHMNSAPSCVCQKACQQREAPGRPGVFPLRAERFRVSAAGSMRLLLNPKLQPEWCSLSTALRPLSDPFDQGPGSQASRSGFCQSCKNSRKKKDDLTP